MFGMQRGGWLWIKLRSVDAMGISLSKAYALTREADFPIVRVGKRVLVPVSEFKVWLSARATEK